MAHKTAAQSLTCCDVEYGLYGCVPVVAGGRNWTLHVLGLLSAGVSKQSRHTNRSLLTSHRWQIDSKAARSTKGGGRRKSRLITPP